MKGIYMYYELADHAPAALRAALPEGVQLMAKKTGEFRPPAAGEWYLSGAIVEAYRAPHALPTAYRIARLVRIQKTITVYLKEV